jgi:hypothetical protein
VIIRSNNHNNIFEVLMGQTHSDPMIVLQISPRDSHINRKLMNEESSTYVKLLVSFSYSFCQPVVARVTHLVFITHKGIYRMFLLSNNEHAYNCNIIELSCVKLLQIVLHAWKNLFVPIKYFAYDVPENRTHFLQTENKCFQSLVTVSA